MSHPIKFLVSFTHWRNVPRYLNEIRALLFSDRVCLQVLQCSDADGWLTRIRHKNELGSPIMCLTQIEGTRYLYKGFVLLFIVNIARTPPGQLNWHSVIVHENSHQSEQSGGRFVAELTFPQRRGSFHKRTWQISEQMELVPNSIRYATYRTSRCVGRLTLRGISVTFMTLLCHKPWGPYFPLENGIPW